MTRLQRGFSKSRIRRRLAAEFMRYEKIPLKGFKRLVNGIFSECIENMTDPQIKRMLYEFLQCTGITAEERAEALKLLQSADTALTGAQLEAMKHSLTE